MPILKEYLFGTFIQQSFGSGSGSGVEPDSVRPLDRDPKRKKSEKFHVLYMLDVLFGGLEASVDWNFFMEAILLLEIFPE
jgi:hypothetical protein